MWQKMTNWATITSPISATMVIEPTVMPRVNTQLTAVPSIVHVMLGQLPRWLKIKDVTQAISGHSSPRRVADSPTRVESSSWEGQNLHSTTRVESSSASILEYSRVFREYSRVFLESLLECQRDPRLESSRVAGRVKYFDSS